MDRSIHARLARSNLDPGELGRSTLKRGIWGDFRSESNPWASIRSRIDRFLVDPGDSAFHARVVHSKVWRIADSDRIGIILIRFRLIEPIRFDSLGFGQNLVLFIQGSLDSRSCSGKTLREFMVVAEAEVKSLKSLYATAGRNADALALYFGEDPARCPFEQVVATLLNFVRMFRKAHEENCKQAELERKKAQKEQEMEKSKTENPPRKRARQPA
ncbi:hypothetical protein Taro_033190 [Colocasia esculenta]|uniref:Uncharacterized protein n=1 Tax=Colocasia esculenta TaxID=4460 RepID=A0A843W679_COLES|nr:hypothetical protein [Colocasia esculenta]